MAPPLKNSQCLWAPLSSPSTDVTPPASSHTLDKGYIGTTIVLLPSPSNEDFSQNNSCCQGGRFYLFPQCILGLLELPFFLRQWVCH